MLFRSNIKIPLLNNINFYSKIKSNNQTNHIQIILLTTKSTKKNKLTNQKNKTNTYLKKPFNIKILQLKLLNNIQLKKKLKIQFKTKSILKPTKIPYTSPNKTFLQNTINIIKNNLSNSNLNIK